MADEADRLRPVLAYTQADAECTNIYMRIPKGFKVEVPVEGPITNAKSKAEQRMRAVEPGEYVLKIVKNLYGQKQAGRVWNKHLVAKLLLAGFTQKPSG